MGVDHLVKVTSFPTRPQVIPAYAKMRDKCLGNVRPATTLLVVQSLARSNYLVEVEATAARD